jgi:4-amino-4-deoxy-L-arabinose transferase-like glycosyltransferase
MTRFMKASRAAPVLVLLACGFSIQFHFLERYPQPILFGDPGAYYVVGQRFQQAVARMAEGEDLVSVFESIRGLLYFAGVGSLYALIDALRPKDIEQFRVVLAGFNSAAMLGVFLLGRRLAGAWAGGLIAVAMASIYPPFSVQTGRIFPDPITGCAFVWSAFFYARGVQDRRPASMIASGLALGTGLLVRSQLIQYVCLLLVFALAASAPWWWRSHRKLALSLALGFLPAAFLWLAIVRAVAGDLRQIEAFGNFTFKQRYPYGFWQFLDTDGFMGPYRLGQEPYYQALEAAASRRPELLTSYPRQLAFTLGYVASRGSESLLLFLDNVYRLYDRPANDYKWDYPFAYSRQVFYQRAILLLAVAGMAVVVAGNSALAGVFFIPGSLALLHGLSYPWPRFNQPAMPILIAGAGAFVFWAIKKLRFRGAVAALALFLLGLAILLASWATRMTLPELARGLRVLGIVCEIGALFAYAAFASGNRRTIASLGLGLVALVGLTGAHEVRRRTWHETELRLGEGVSEIQQEIALSSDGLARLRRASEVFLVFDLHIPEGNPRGLAVIVNGREFALEDWIPTMPRFGESTAAGGRDRRGFRQWWAIRLPPEVLAASVHIALRSTRRAPVIVYGDRFREQKSRYEGPSFGEWPHLAAVKLEYDGDYRLSVRRPLESVGSESFIVDEDGSRSAFAGVHRIRILELGTNEGRLSWETEAFPPSPRAAIGFFAYSGKTGTAELILDGAVAAKFPLGSAEDFEVSFPPRRLCHRAEAPRGDMGYGGYVVFTPAERAGPLSLTVRFLSGMSAEPLFFSLDQRRDRERLLALISDCQLPPGVTPVDGVGRILDASANHYPEDTGRWSVVAVH